MDEERQGSSETHVRDCVEELALDLVLGSHSAADRLPNWRKSLAQVVELAEQSGLTEVASQAARLRASLDGSDESSSADLETRVQAGVVALQRVLALGEAASARQSPALELPDAEDVNPLAEDPEAVGDFIVESREHFEAIDRQLLALEERPGEIEPVHDLFRRFHTLKGLAGFLDLQPIRELSHAVENVLNVARESVADVSPDSIEVLFAAADQLRADVDSVEEALKAKKKPEFADRVDLISRLAGKTRDSRPAPALPGAQTPSPAADSPRTADGRSGRRMAATRVDPAKLDHLVELAGELIVAHSQVAQDPQLLQRPDGPLASKMAGFARLTQEIQASAMSLRMVPVEQLFDRTARLVRDLGRRCGKQVRLESLGGETAVDRAVVELLADPMVHLIRNALDHGIESPAERAAAGKPAVAVLTVEASHHAGHILIEIRDDGKGLDRRRVRRRAEERKIISPGQRLSDSEIDDLIFQPGFSTASAVTDLSGRGVGLDVVRRHVKSLRGWVDVSSKDGEGVCFRLFIPLTLALIEGLTVSVGQERYVAPLSAVQEIVRPSSGMLVTVEGRRMTASVRDELYPILRLDRYFGIEGGKADLGDMFLVLTEVGDKRFGLAVDSFVGKQDVIVKSLAPMGGGRTQGISGGTILGDGRVALILDLESLADAA